MKIDDGPSPVRWIAAAVTCTLIMVGCAAGVVQGAWWCVFGIPIAPLAAAGLASGRTPRPPCNLDCMPKCPKTFVYHAFKTKRAARTYAKPLGAEATVRKLKTPWRGGRKWGVYVKNHC